MIALAVARFQVLGGDRSAPDDPADRAAPNRHGFAPDAHPERVNPVASHINAGLLTMIVGHATFCIVVVFNNVTARLRRRRPLESASADLGATPLTTFRLVTFPHFAPRSLPAPCWRSHSLRRDRGHHVNRDRARHLPIWIFNNLSRPNPAPVVNVVAVILVAVSILPVWLALR